MKKKNNLMKSAPRLVLAISLSTEALAADLHLTCVRTSTEWGNFSTMVHETEDRAEIAIKISEIPGSKQAQVTYNSDEIFRGNLEKDDEIFITESENDRQYPRTVRRLLLDRVSGEGYFQKSIYKDGDSLPDFKTENLARCRTQARRF